MLIRVPVIPGFNDDQANIVATGRFAQSLETVSRIDLLPYNRGGLEKSARLTDEPELMDTRTPDKEKMEQIAEILVGQGFDVGIGG